MSKLIITTTDAKGKVVKQTVSQGFVVNRVLDWLANPEAATINIEKPHA